jgi:Zn-dependent protease
MSIISLILAFVIAITVHEAAHAWMSDRLGDPTARLAGRMTFNPLKHLDIYGTVLVPLLLLIFRSPILFGWAKPVMFDPYNLKKPRRDAALISFAGPAANILLAILLSVVMRLATTPFSPFSFLTILFSLIIELNVVLAIFNLIPIHPLDGGKVLVSFLPENDAKEADAFLNRYGIIILFLMIFPLFGGTSPLFYLITPVINFILKLLIPGATLI